MRHGGAVLVVLPFQTPGGTEEEAVIAQGLLEDICGELARFPALQVVSWGSALALADLTDPEIGSRLRATHVLRGSLRGAGERFRISVSLVECESGAQVWSERFDFPGNALFDIQDEIVGRLAGTLVARLEEASVKKSLRRPAASLAAYELTLRGLTELRQGTYEADEAARALFRRAIEIDPHYARAHAGMSLSYFNEWSCQYWNLFQENGQLAYTHAHRALELDDRDAMLHVVIGRIQLYRREFEKASWYFDRAFALCPNDADLLTQLSSCEVFMGRPETAMAYVDRAMRLNPYHPNMYHGFKSFAYFGQRDFENALAALERAAEVPIVDVPAYAAVALAHLGRLEEARVHLDRYGAAFRQMITYGREPNPGEPVRWLLEVNPYRRPEDLEFLVEGFRLLADSGSQLALAVPATSNGSDTTQSFVRAGDGWVVEFASRRIVLPELKGLADIHRLLANPREEFHCLDLAERISESDGGDDVLDDKAREALKRRLRDLQEEIAEAEDHNDYGRAERLRAEFESLVETLSSALGIGGRSRRLGNIAERARTSVTWRIRHAVRRIEAVHQPLARHLAHSLRTGTFCSYAPERDVSWRLTADPQPAALQAGRA